MKSQRERRKATIKKRRKLREKLLRNCPTCEVPLCGRQATDMHHMANPGIGMKDDSYSNLAALCHDHHMQIDALNWSKERWAKTFFWGSTYAQVTGFIAMKRRLELAGKPVGSVLNIPPIHIKEEGAFQVIQNLRQNIFSSMQIPKEEHNGRT